MFTWNLPALIRNVVLFTLFCIFLNWNLMAWIFILFLVFVEMDEELAKYENYSDYYTAQLQLYDFSHVSNNGWNLEEQLRIFNQQNPEVVQQYQRTFNSRIQELRKHPTKIRPQDKAKKAFNKKEELRVKQEVFGYTENYWDEQETLFTNEYVEIINHISSNSMYAWYHQNGLVIPEQEYGIKNICLYYSKYTDINEDPQYNMVIQSHINELYTSMMQNKLNIKSLPKPYNRQIGAQEKKKIKNNLLYWQMSDYQRAQYNQPLITHKIDTKYIDKRISHINHIKDLCNTPPQLLAGASDINSGIIKQLQIPLQTFNDKYEYTSRKSLNEEMDRNIIALLKKSQQKKNKSKRK